MIQRIQSVYLLLVTILLVVAICMPVGQFIGADGVTAHVFKPLGVALADGGFQSTWGLFGILLLSALVAFCTIFLFRNRMLQIRMTIFSSILLIGYYIAFCVFMFILKGDLDAMTFQLGWALCLPVVAIILNYLADNGQMQTGWFTQDGEEYYLDPDTGVMARNTTIDGHEMNSSGVKVS